MSDESKAERLHLEGLDEATERERWEEHHATTDRETEIAALLHKHSDMTFMDNEEVRCICSTLICMATEDWDDAHRAHVAAVLAAHMADREADAWLKGHLSGMHHSHPDVCDDEICPNPFRLTPDTEGETDE